MVEPYGPPQPGQPAPQFPPPAPPLPPTEPVSRSRRAWPWVLAVVLVVVIGTAIAGAAVIIPSLSVGTTEAAAAGSPQAVVEGFNRAFEKADCTAFTKVTTAAFRKDYYNGDFSCSAFVSDAKEYRVDGKYAYTFTVTASKSDGGTATVTVDEVDSSGGSTEKYTNIYRLTKTGSGAWVVSDVGDAGES
ncbi:Rv0361 family membrane protein [Schumannella soli]|uniref:DUF4878 domain-containing protein n=1 Tax=Schumannella soli TaxID=2590779 RepID=A0A506XWJ3_9MICO|nr:hypothetical protein [Schumannella soli]TPW74576.1 hypothetical protein FJ657_13340 [Schumannella soli]